MRLERLGSRAAGAAGRRTARKPVASPQRGTLLYDRSTRVGNGHVREDSFWSTFEALARTAGAVEAVLAPGRAPLRFADVPARLLAIRDALASHGIGPGDRVASVLPRGPETALCFLGVASCAIHVPLNPDYTGAEFTKYLSRLRPKALIVPADDRSAARDCAVMLGVPVIDLVIEKERAAGSFSLSFREAARPVAGAWNTADDVALVLLTSGTTSEAKLVPVRQRHLLAYARASREHYRLTSADRGLHVMPMFHGHGLKSSLFVPLACGSGVVCPPGFDIPSFFRHIAEFRPTWYSAAASIHRAILERIDEYRDIARDARLRFIRSGSARLDPKVLAGLERAFDAPMVERYGMSETCTLASNALPPAERRPGSVGKPMFNEVMIVDAAGRPVPHGAIGEVVARGPGVVDGYLDDPAATAAAFVGGWFRTGDLGRLDADGFLTLAGRIKDVINRGGEKVGAVEVESALLRHPAVAEACVFAMPHPTLGEEIGAAVVLARNLAARERELQGHVRRLLAGFKIPRRIAILPSLPKTATGKVDRDAVARSCMSAADAAAGIRAPVDDRPRSDLEREIAQMWRRTLGVPGLAIGRDDDFFLLGGDSLQAYELFAQLRIRYGVGLGLGHLFDDAATVAGMARLVEAGRRGGDRILPAARLVPIKDDGDRPPLFAVPGSGGNPVGYVHLARLLDRRQPLIGVASRGLDGSSPPLRRVEDIAADNLREIRRVQPSGPYFFAGACYGARVAYEMARQVDAAGERVGLLLMLDPSSPFHRADGSPRGGGGRPRGSPRRALLGFLRDRIVLHASTFAKLDPAERAAFVREKAMVLRDILRRRDIFRGDRSEIHQRLVYAANREAGGRYVPGSFAGPVVLCFTRDRPVRGARNYRLDWLELLPQSGGPNMVAGNDSGQMLDLPHVYELAEHVNRWLNEAHGALRAPAPASVA